MTPESAHLTSQKGSNIIITAVVQQSARSLPANWVGEKLPMKLMESDQEKKKHEKILNKRNKGCQLSLSYNQTLTQLVCMYVLPLYPQNYEGLRDTLFGILSSLALGVLFLFFFYKSS